MKRALESRRLPLYLMALVTLMLLPTLRMGLVVDDFVLRGTVLRTAVARLSPAGPLDLFRFVDGDRMPISGMIEVGALPWWASPDLRLAFFRPLASASHWLDFHLFPGSPAAMHLESVALYAGMVAVAWALYRRFFGATWAAGLAATAFAVDPGHAISAGWISSRNAVLAALFGMLSLLAHDRWRRDGARVHAILAVLALAASLASGESGLGTVAFLVAHALTLDGPGLRRRAEALAPHAVVVAAWAAVYRATGSGTAHSGIYLDPLRDTVAYLRAASLYAPVNLGGRLGGPPASLVIFLADRLVPAFAAVGALFIVLAAVALAKPLRRDPVARFFALGAILATVPVSATIPNDRNLFFVGFGGFALTAVLVRRAIEEGGLGLRAYAAWSLFLTCVVAPLSFPVNATSMNMFARLSRDPLERILQDDAVRSQTVVFVNPPGAFFASHFMTMRAASTEPTPLAVRMLAPGIYPMSVRRTGTAELLVHVPGGLHPTPGTWPATPGPAPAGRIEYLSQSLDSFSRGRDEPMHAGDKIPLRGCTVEIRAVTEGGSPVDVAFTFDRPLEDPGLRWVAWEGEGYVPFTPPALGEEKALAGASIAP